VGAVSVGMSEPSWLQVNVIFVYCVCRGEGARLNDFRNLCTVNEIKVIDDCNKSNMHYDISSYC